MINLCNQEQIALINKPLLFTTIAFFILVNSAYFWESQLGLFVFAALLTLALIFIILFVSLIRQISLSIKERFVNKHRIYFIILLVLVLTLAVFKPYGFINFEKWESNSVLIAQREGTANCLTTFKLKENRKFSERNLCFGISETTGTYRIKNDTIYFENMKLGRGEDKYYEYAVIKTSKINDKYLGVTRYENQLDTIGNELLIIKNELKRMN